MTGRVYIRDELSRPIAAILTTDDDVRVFRGDRASYRDIIRTGDELGVLVYVTTVKYLKIGEARVLGYRPRMKGKGWKRSWFPAPKVVYNRIPFRKHERRPEVRRKIEEILNQPAIQFFNPSFFNKWDLMEWLSDSPKTRQYLPDTRKFNEELDLEVMLKKYPYLYLKPVRGKAGSGIMRVKRLRRSAMPYQLSVQERRKSTVYSYRTIDGLQRKIGETIGTKAYIAQQGIQLARSDASRPFDLRLLAQKDGAGEWQVTGIGARVAGELSITTHVPRGGSIERPLKMLGAVFGKPKARQILTKARQAALVIARQIERACGHSLGEMSMDMGIDAQGELWFFEANSKPMKFDEPHIRRKSLQRLAEYFRYLSEKSAVHTLQNGEFVYGPS